MRNRIAASMLAALLGIPLFAGGCARSPASASRVVVLEREKGPPPHAVAHGYRHHHPDGTALIFDSGLGVYAVAGRTGLFFWDGIYFRPGGEGWESAVSLDGRWAKAKDSRIPPGLKKQAKSSDKAGRRGRVSN